MKNSTKFVLLLGLLIVCALVVYMFFMPKNTVSDVNTDNSTIWLIENEFPEWFPVYKVTGESAVEKDFLVAPHTTNYEDGWIFIMDHQGKLKRSKRLSSFAYSFREILGEDGKTYYAYQQVEWPMPRSWWALEMTHIVLMDEDLNEIDDNIKLLKHWWIPYDWYPSENHEYEVLWKDHYILAAAVETAVDNIPGHEWESYYVFNNIVQEQKDWEVVWQRESIDYPELYDTQLTIGDWNGYNVKISEMNPENYGVADYAHINAFEYTDDNKLLISFRNIGLVKVDLNTNKIMWVMSKKRNDIKWLNPEDIWLYQHDVEILDDWSFTIFDNSWDENKRSRLCRYKIDDENNELINVETYITNRPESRFMWSAHLVDDDNSIFDIAYWWNMSDIAFEEFDFNTNKQLMRMWFDDGHDLYSIERWL